MEADLWLINDLHQHILANPRAVHALRVLTQIYSKHGMTTEAAQTARNLLDIDHQGLDQETYDTLSPTVVKHLEAPNRTSRVMSPRVESLTSREVRRSVSYHAQGYNHSSTSPPPYSPSERSGLHSFTDHMQSSHRQEPPPSPSFTARHAFPTTLRSQSAATLPTTLFITDNSAPTTRRPSRLRLPFRSKTSRQRESSNGDEVEFAACRPSRDAPHVHPTERREIARKPIPSSRLPPIQQIADQMAADPRNSLATAIDDLAAVVHLTRQRPTPAPPPSSDAIRSACVARTHALAAVLHPKHAYLAHQALMHATHERLAPTYANDATMVAMEPIATIPRARFFASEDNYAWDMAELVAALRANPAAAPRNPLSRAPFTEADVTAIVHHPLGRGLAAVRVAQAELRRGVRAEVLRRLARLARVLLADEEDSMEASRLAMDDFAAYRATLPRAERDALFALRVPARDRHTGLGYDASVGEMLRDAKANQVCGHKAGDFLSQAVDYLTKSSRRWTVLGQG